MMTKTPASHTLPLSADDHIAEGQSLRRLVISEASLSAAKWLALALMMVDHWNHYLLGGSVRWMFDLGRISMPLFAFVLGYNIGRPEMFERGGFHRLAVRLAVFGVLATPPFLAMGHLVGGWWPLNMMFTLLVAVATAWLIEVGSGVAVAASVIVFAWGGGLAEYWWPAVGMVLAVWRYQRKPSRAAIAGFIFSITALWTVNGNFWALGAMPVLWMLHRWWRVELPRAQWVFYGFYPAHLALIWFYLKVAH